MALDARDRSSASTTRRPPTGEISSVGGMGLAAMIASMMR
jgi:hypothetical protein